MTGRLDLWVITGSERSTANTPPPATKGLDELEEAGILIGEYLNVLRNRTLDATPLVNHFAGQLSQSN